MTPRLMCVMVVLVAACSWSLTTGSRDTLGADDAGGDQYLHSGEVEDAERQEVFPNTTLERAVLRDVIRSEVTAMLKKAWPRLFPATSVSMRKKDKLTFPRLG
ncbi:uncharacterized protein LOC144906794 [Branchiostoma floridae x Branchiostoma belcheri]|nr:hypothetical protein Bbelb_225660 [Branchiostoma belcheri]